MRRLSLSVLTLAFTLLTFAHVSTASASTQASIATTPHAVLSPHITQSPETGCYHTVQAGETLSGIDPSGWQSVYVPSGNPNLIYPGQVLNLCSGGSTPQAQPQVTYSYTTSAPSSGRTYPNIGVPGWCMWYAFNQNPYIYVPPSPNPVAAFYNSRASGIPTGYTPVVGSFVVFWPYVQGASSVGHMAYVSAVYGGGAFQIREMTNWYSDTRTVYTGSGVAFIY